MKLALIDRFFKITFLIISSLYWVLQNVEWYWLLKPENVNTSAKE